jgi:hypothetical protein
VFQLLIASRLINLAISGRDASAQRSRPYLLLLAPVFFLVRLLVRLANPVTFLSPRGGTSLCPSPLDFPANERDRARSSVPLDFSSSLCYSLVFPRDFSHLFSRIISTRLGARVRTHVRTCVRTYVRVCARARARAPVIRVSVETVDGS